MDQSERQKKIWNGCNATRGKPHVTQRHHWDLTWGFVSDIYSMTRKRHVSPVNIRFGTFSLLHAHWSNDVYSALKIHFTTKPYASDQHAVINKKFCKCQYWQYSIKLDITHHTHWSPYGNVTLVQLHLISFSVKTQIKVLMIITNEKIS